MERKALLYWAAQVMGWGAYFVLSVLLLRSTNEVIITLNLSIYIISSIAVSILLSHNIRYFIIKKSLVSGSLWGLILWTLLLSVIAASILELTQYLVAEYVIKVDFIMSISDGSEKIDAANFIFAVFKSVLLFLLWTGFYLTFVFIEQNRQQEIQRLMLSASEKEIELKNLRAQLNPHFLFNSLNSIRALVGLNPEQAKSAITRLSSLLRNSINLGKHTLVSLSDEIELVKNYLELEKIRFEERLQINYSIDEKSLNCSVPPLMVQTIVENAIKHGISKSIDGGTITLKTHYSDNTLVLTVENPGQLNNTLAESGIGVDNTKKRLEIIFGEKGLFEVIQNGENVVAKIYIDYR